MLRHQQRAYVLRPLAFICTGTGKQRFTRLLHDTMLRRDAILTIDNDTQRLAQVFLRVQRLSVGVELVPAYG